MDHAIILDYLRRKREMEDDASRPRLRIPLPEPRALLDDYEIEEGHDDSDQERGVWTIQVI
jgi:hypothetical protein